MVSASSEPPVPVVPVSRIRGNEPHPEPRTGALWSFGGYSLCDMDWAKQTARASTGGKVPHREIATRAARRSAGIWRENGHDVRVRSSHRVNREFIDFEDRRNAELLPSLWEHAGRSEISALRYQVEECSFCIRYKPVSKRPSAVAAVSVAGARLLFGPHVLAFASARLARKVWFTADRCYRLGLTESHGDGTEYS